MSNVNKGWTDRMRKRIKASGYIDLLDKHIKGEHEMSDSQMRACLSLIDRVLPKLSQQQIKSEVTVTKEPRHMTEAELIAFLQSPEAPEHTEH